MKKMRLKATIPSAILLGKDENGNPQRFDLFYTVSNYPEQGDDPAPIFGPDWLERFARYEDAHNTKGAARRTGTAFVDAAEAASRAIVEGFTATEATEAILEAADDYGKLPGERRKANEDELAELREWVMEKLATEPEYSFGPAMTITAAALKKGAEMAAAVLTLTPEQREALAEGMERRGFTAWNLEDTPAPTPEECAVWLTHRARFDQAAAKADPLAAMA